MLDQRLRLALKNQSFLDIGANVGDFALVFSEYAKDIDSIELSDQNFAAFNCVLAHRPFLPAGAQTFRTSVGDNEGITHLMRDGGGR
jgi:hypothetical protein